MSRSTSPSPMTTPGKPFHSIIGKVFYIDEKGSTPYQRVDTDVWSPEGRYRIDPVYVATYALLDSFKIQGYIPITPWDTPGHNRQIIVFCDTSPYRQHTSILRGYTPGHTGFSGRHIGWYPSVKLVCPCNITVSRREILRVVVEGELRMGEVVNPFTPGYMLHQIAESARFSE